MKVLQISRKPSRGQFSLERLTRVSRQEFENNSISNVMLPYSSQGIMNKFKNILFVMRLGKRDVTHVLGDIHYIIPFLRSTTIILTLLDFVALDRKFGVHKFLYKLFWFDLPLLFVSKVTTLSEKIKEETVNRYPKYFGSIYVIPSPLDPIFNLPPTLTRTAGRLLFIGVKENKNLTRTIDAINQLEYKGPLTLVLVAPSRPSCLEKLNPNVSVEVKSSLSDLDLLEEYDKAELLLFPSLSEGFGLPIVEAQSRKCAVITSDREPMRSVAGSLGAILVNPECVSSLCEGLSRALDLKNDIHIQAGILNSGNYSAELYVERHVRLYKAII